MGSETPKVVPLKKISPDESKKLDRTKMGVGRPTPAAGQVEGQAKSIVFGLCPNCGAGNYVVADTAYWTWYTCWNCGWPFRV